MASVAAILVVSCDLETRNVIEKFSLSCSYKVISVPSSQDAMSLVRQGAVVDRVLLDVDNRADDYESRYSLIEWSGNDRLCLLSSDISSVNPGIGRILAKPIHEEDLHEPVSDVAAILLPLHELNERQGQTALPYHLEELSNNRFFLASSPTMMKLYKEIRLLAPVNIPVLLLGESGVGKEIVAMLLHKYHCLTDRTFLNVNCAALPTDLLESELFGYEAGAFTGAMKSKPGKFELANKGTLLLDEIGEMSSQMQAKLLHVLQDGSFSRLGARTPTKVDVRILAATNIDMQKGIAEKRFREDLYYRLNTFAITIPPLRERREEIPFLIKEMVARGASELCRPVVFENWLTEAAQDYQWPGNLRELRNFVMRTLILQDQQSAYLDLRAKTQAAPGGTKHKISEGPISPPDATEPAGMKGTINEVKNRAEVRLLSDALTVSGWNRRKAAARLNISYRSLLYKIQQHGLSA
jgi:two-component system, NtrC family, response regulator AtoC